MVKPIVVGEITGAYGIKGWVKIQSYTVPPKNILGYGPWIVEYAGISQEFKVLNGHAQGASVVAQLEGIEDRDLALKLRSGQISVPRDRLPPLETGHYYWADLVGLTVSNLEGVAFGTVTDMLATGSNDVLVVQGERERLIPFVPEQYVKTVDLEQGNILVDWDPEF